MPITKEQFEELQPLFNKLSNHLFHNAVTFIRNRGNFLPFAAVLRKDASVHGIMANPGTHTDSLVSSIEVLPALHDSVRATAKQEKIDVLAICEHVHLQDPNKGQTSTIKVLIEHKGGACIALYLPFHQSTTGAHEFGSVSWKPAEPEVQAWRTNNGTTIE